MERKVNIKHFDANKNNILYINEECPEFTPNKICWEMMAGQCMKRLLHSEWLLLYLPQQNNRKTKHETWRIFCPGNPDLARKGGFRTPPWIDAKVCGQCRECVFGVLAHNFNFKGIFSKKQTRSSSASRVSQNMF